MTDFANIINIFSTKPNIELELRVGQYVTGKGFDSSVTESEYKTAIFNIEATHNFKFVGQTDSVVESHSLPEDRYGNVRKITWLSKTGMTTEYQVKKRIRSEFMNKHHDKFPLMRKIDRAVRISAAMEKPTSSGSFTKSGNVTKRTRRRRSYTDGLLTVEITAVKCGSKTVYEFEIEVIKSKEFMKDPYGIIGYALQILNHALPSDAPKPVGASEPKVSRVNQPDHVSIRILKKIVYLTKKFNNRGFIKLESIADIKRFYNNPREISYEDLRSGTLTFNDVAATIKLDGVRYMLVVVHSNKNIYVFAMNPRENILIHSTSKNPLPNSFDKVSVIDVEYFNGKYYAFDAMMVDSVDVRGESFSNRIEHQSRVMKLLPAKMVGFKKFYYSKTESREGVIETLNKALDESLTRHNDTDGIIIIPQHSGYSFAKVYKFKDPRKLSIDFRLVKIPGKGTDNHRYQIFSYGQKDKPEQFKGTPKYPHSGEIQIKPDDDVYKTDDIVEFAIRSNRFIPMRKRGDKIRPNYIKIATDIWGMLNNPLGYKEFRDLVNKYTIDDGRTLLGRSHGMVKSTIVAQFIRPKSNNIGIGIGRGGDLGKYERARVNQVFGIEPDKSNFEEFIRRRASIKKGASRYPIVNMGVSPDTVKTLIDAISDYRKEPVLEIDNINSFFSLSFFFSSYAMLVSLMRLIDLSTKVGSKFIGTTVTGVPMNNLLKDTKQWKSQSIEITREYEDTRNVGVGQKIIFDFTKSITGKQTEYLVDYENMKRILFSIGFEETYSRQFGIDSSLTPETQTVNKLYRSFVFTRNLKTNVDVAGIVKAVYQDSTVELLPYKYLDGGFVEQYSFTTNSPVAPAVPAVPAVPKKLIMKKYPYLKSRTVDRFIGYPNPISRVLKLKAYRIGVIGDGSCFFHAYLRATSQTYTMLTRESDRMKFIRLFRLVLSKNFSFNSISTGEMEARMVGVYFELNEPCLLTHFKKHIPNYDTIDPKGSLVYAYIANSAKIITPIIKDFKGESNKFILQQLIETTADLIGNYDQEDGLGALTDEDLPESKPDNFYRLVLDALYHYFVEYRDSVRERLKKCDVFFDEEMASYIFKTLPYNIFIMNHRVRMPIGVTRNCSYYDKSKKYSVVIVNVGHGVYSGNHFEAMSLEPRADYHIYPDENPFIKHLINSVCSDDTAQYKVTENYSLDEDVKNMRESYGEFAVSSDDKANVAKYAAKYEADSEIISNGFADVGDADVGDSDSDSDSDSDWDFVPDEEEADEEEADEEDEDEEDEEEEEDAEDENMAEEDEEEDADEEEDENVAEEADEDEDAEEEEEADEDAEEEDADEEEDEDAEEEDADEDAEEADADDHESDAEDESDADDHESEVEEYDLISNYSSEDVSDEELAKSEYSGSDGDIRKTLEDLNLSAESSDWSS